MTLTNVEQVLSLIRAHLVECVTRGSWGDNHAAELAATVAACLRQATDESNRDRQQQDPRLSHDALRRAIRFVNENLDSKLKWNDIALDVGLDPFTFGRGFKRATGMTPRQYIIRCRLRRAMKLLVRDDHTLADVALEVGCSCQSHLTTMFRKHLGTTPGAFRASAREGRQQIARVARPMPSNTGDHRAIALG